MDDGARAARRVRRRAAAWMLPLSLLVGLGLGGAAVAGERETMQPRIWLHDSVGRLGVLDLADGSLTRVGPMDVVLTDIAFAPDGRLYGVSFTDVYEVGRAGDLRRIGRHGVPCGNALEIAPDGAAYAMGCSSDGLYQLDLETGRGDLLFSIGYASSGDLAWRDGGLLLSSGGFGGADLLVALDLDGQSARLVGPFGLSRVYGLAAAPDGRLYAGAGNRYFAVDPATGRAELMGDYFEAGFAEVYGWAIERDIEPIFVAAPASLGAS